ncbi:MULTISPECIES: GTPase [Acinetobacter]|uniref:GTPase n=1 Tax=Acinetobacter wuhouensis TaxID=1879050 RepID=A0A3G2T3F0_9GAMM|nr:MULTISPECIES: GTPase [Acinetobacter]AYO54744.1 GTPase [Acinetobacter wuhouensis]RZG76156.1 GTPase [Acinetobacter sp. WCHAc060025]RZG87970.1 GTPase [Acinetobacter sp. WCHAc060033]
MINKEISEIFQNITVLQRDKLSFADSSVESVTAWVATLSIMQLGDTSQSVLQAICEISELNCSETLRFDLIQILHPITESILSSLEKNILNQGLSQSERLDHIVDLSSRIRTYFTNVYINIVQRSHQELTSNKLSFFNFKQKRNLKTARTLATFYALEQLGLLLIQQQMIYSGRLTHQWLATHHLYELAVKNQEHNININQLQGTHFTIQNIQQAYAQVLLLDIFNTHQIRPTETQALYQCTFDWVKLVQVLPRETMLSRYIVDGSKDVPPIYNRKQHVNFHTSLYISTQNLLEHVNSTIHRESEYLSKNEQLYLSAALKFHVQNVLGTTTERQHERYEYSAQLQMCFSIPTAHFYLSKAKNFAETLNLNSNYGLQSESNKHSSIASGSDVASNFSDIKHLDREAKQIYQAQVLDISMNGYRIRWDNVAPKSLRTGEFILINESLNNKWKGAIIRWIKQSVNKTYEVGLEVLAQDIYPCAVKVPADRSTVNFHPCLMVIVQNLNESDISIILPNLPFFKEQQAIYLRLETEEIKVYLTKTLLITQSFAQYEFELMNDEQNHLIEQFIQKQSTNLNNQDVWEALK